MVDNTDFFKSELEKAIERGLVKIGIVAEGYAKDECPVDTGRLAGSIVFATSTVRDDGESPANPDDYTPRGPVEKNTVIIGTNVEYAQHVELGTSKQKAQPFLRPAAENHTEEYKRLLKSELQGQ